jgi:tetratricopeptide (TPR) repeat protein
MATTKDQVITFLRQNRLQEAEALCHALCETTKDDANNWFLLAGIHARRGNFEHVVACCRHVIELDPRQAGAHYNLGVALMQLARFEEAAAAYQATVQLMPNHAGAHAGLAQAYHVLGRHAEAERHLRECLRLEPANASRLLELGNLVAAQGRRDEAIECFRSALRLFPNNAPIWNSLGLALNDAGKLAEAEECFTRAVGLKPDMAEGYNNLAVAQETQGKFVPAEKNYRQALKLAPQGTAVRNHLGYLLADDGRHEDAMREFERVLGESPGDAMATAGKAHVLEKQGRYQEAYEWLRPLIDGGSNNIDAIKIFGVVCLRLKREREAVAPLERVLQAPGLSGNAASALNFVLGDLHDRLQETDQAFLHYQKANEAAPHTFDPAAHAMHVDRIIGTFSPEAMQTLPRADNHDERPVFIVGMPRSGTSLVEQILSCHPQVQAAGELRDLGDLAASLPRVLGTPESYLQALNLLTKEAANSLAQTYLSRLTELSSGASRVTDKMPHNFMRLGLIELLFPGARVIHVARNPLDTCLSLYCLSFNPLHSYTTDLAHLGQYYRHYERLMEHWRRTLSIPMLTLQYEDLVEDLDAKARSLLEFCGLPWDDRCLAFHESRRNVKTPSYDQVRRPIYRSSVGRWKRYEKFLGPLITALGPRE